MGGITRTAEAASDPRQWSREAAAKALLLAMLLLGLPLVLASTPKILSDGDVSWHIATGQWMFQHWRIPTTDPFSFTAAGRPWVATEWLAELVYAAAFGLASYSGLSAVVAACLIATNLILFLHLRRFVGPIGLAAALVGAGIVLSPYVIARPHLLVWPLLAGWTVMLLRASETGRPPPLWSALILVAWTNLHASFPLALPVAVALGFDSLWKTQWREWKSWGVFILVSVVALMLNANGLAGLVQPFKIADLKMLPLIQEWQPSTPSSTPQFYAVLLIAVGAMLYRGVRVPAGRLVLLLVMLAMAFSQVRHQCWFAIVAAAAVPPLFETKPAPMPAVAPFAFAALPLLLVRALWPLTPPETPTNPWHLIAAVPQPLRTQPVFNGYSFGGPLILSGIRPYIDGRADLYGDTFVLNYVDITDGDWAKFNDAVRRYGIRWTILPNSDGKLIRELDSSADWSRAASTAAGVVHFRRKPILIATRATNQLRSSRVAQLRTGAKSAS